VSVPYPRWQRRHEGVLLWLIEHASGTLRECAKVTGYTPSHLSRIMCSPDFRYRLSLLRAKQERQVLAHIRERWTDRNRSKNQAKN
jgi:hypothetical protein